MTSNSPPKHEPGDPLVKALAETELASEIHDAIKPIASYDAPLRFLILGSLWGLWSFYITFAALLAVTRQAPLQPIIISSVVPLGVLIILHLTIKKERFLIFEDRVVRLKEHGELAFSIKDVTIKSRTAGLKTRFALDPKEASPPGLFSQEAGHFQVRTIEILMLLKRLGAKVEAPEWKADDAMRDSAWLVKSSLNDVSPVRLLLGTLIGISCIAAVISLVVIPILWAVIAVCLLAAFGYVCFELIKAIERGATRKPTGVLFDKDHVAWLQKGMEIWSVKADDIRRFEVSSARGLVSFALVTNYGRRYDLLAVYRNEALRQINGRGYELVWAEKGPEEGRFLP